MLKLPRIPYFRFKKWWVKQRRVWKCPRLAPRPWNANDGVATALVAILLLAILLLLAFFMNTGGALLTRQRLETMAEFGAAGGGRIMAEMIAARAEKNVNNGLFLPPQNEDDKKHPERFLTPADRTEFQTDNAAIQAVDAGTRDYVKKNAWKGFPLEKVADPSVVTVTYPVLQNDCTGSEKRVDIKVVIRYAYPLLIEKLSEAITGQSAIMLAPESNYSVTLCP
ncbi:MAG: hypothetical protein EXS55_04410 [Candidatus Magasanikbacteria bacterium]|nr:hypothetical protein [Candidatus Magasanikbacteria bacterium]